MSIAGQKVSGGIYLFFYWTGVTLALACIGVAVLGNSSIFAPLEHTSLPLSWQLGGLAVLAFLAAEFGCPAPAELSEQSESQAASHQLSAEWEAVEF